MFARLYYKIVTMVFMNGVPLLALQDQKIQVRHGLFFLKGGVGASKKK